MGTGGVFAYSTMHPDRSNRITPERPERLYR
jgi:hypothetical protein